MWGTISVSVDETIDANRVAIADGSVGTVNLYSKKAAIVQTGWKTQMVSKANIEETCQANLVKVLGFISVSIFGTCIILLVITRLRDSKSSDS